VRAARLAAPLLFVVFLLASGCAQSYDASTRGVPATMASPAGQAPQGDRFSVSSKAVYGFWGALRFKQPSLQKALAAQLGAGTGVADLKIKVRSRWSDLLISALTAGIIVPRSVTYEGVVTR